MSSQLGGSLQEVRSARCLHVATHVVGADTTLFFLHGAGGNKEQWRFQWSHFDDGLHNRIAWDAIGHGESPQPRVVDAYDGAALVDDARALFARYGAGRNIIIAHSYGARVALALLLAEAAEGRPSAIDALVLIGPAPLGSIGGRGPIGGWIDRIPLPLLELARPLLALSFGRLAWHPDADRRLVRAEQRATRGNSLFMMRALMSGAPKIDSGALSRLSLPILVLAGEDDKLVPLDSVKGLTEKLPNVSLRVVQRCGHQIMLEKPAETNEAIRDALAVLART